MKYYPSSRIIKNQQSNPSQFVDPKGKEYVGPYYTTFKGDSFTGASPSKGASIPLTPIAIDEIQQNMDPITLANSKFDTLKHASNNVQLTNPEPFTPRPTEADYKTGKIIRYFARQRNGTTFKIVEISNQTHNNLVNNTNGANFALWKSIALFWRISGPLRNEKINNITTRSGIIDTNQRILDQAEKSFIGIKQYLSDLQQFARVT